MPAPAVQLPYRHRSTPPAVTSQREQGAALKNRVPLFRPPSSAQESLIAFQAVGHEILILPNQDIARASPLDIPSSPPTAAASTDTIQHVGVTAHGDKAKARDILGAVQTLKTIEETLRPATPDERQTLARFPGVLHTGWQLPQPQWCQVSAWGSTSGVARASAARGCHRTPGEDLGEGRPAAVSSAGWTPLTSAPISSQKNRQALVAEEQRPRVLMVLVGRVRVSLLTVPNAQAGIRQRPLENGPDQGDVALHGVGVMVVRISGHGLLPLPIGCASRARHPGPWTAARDGPTACVRRSSMARKPW